VVKVPDTDPAKVRIRILTLFCIHFNNFFFIFFLFLFFAFLLFSRACLLSYQTKKMCRVGTVGTDT
jgi:hypothetical protein